MTEDPLTGAPFAVTLTVMYAHEFCVYELLSVVTNTDRVVVEAELTVRLTVTEWVSEPLVPVTVRE